jgi:hypothetical protein
MARKSKLSQEQKAALYVRYIAGEKVVDLAKEVKVTPATLYIAFKRFGEGVTTLLGRVEEVETSQDEEEV